MIPFNHPIWENKTDPVIKKVTENFWWDGNQEDFFIIEGVENIPLEKSPPNYWKWLSSYKEPVFHRIVGLNDKITIAEAKNSEIISPIENKPNNDQTIKNSLKNHNSKTSDLKVSASQTTDLEKLIGKTEKETKKLNLGKDQPTSQERERERRRITI